MKHRSPGNRRRLFLGLFIAAGVATLTSAAGVWAATHQGNIVLVGATAKDDAEMSGDPNENPWTVPIKDNEGNSVRRVVLSLKRNSTNSALPDVLPGDRLQPLAEMQITTDCSPQEVQVGCPKTEHPYDYSPTVAARLIMADSPSATTSGGADGAILLGENQQTTCTHAEHHCIFTFRTITEDIFTSNDPCDQSDGSPCFINLVVNAWNASGGAHSEDVVIIGDQTQPGGGVDHDRAQISVARSHPQTYHGGDVGTSLIQQTGSLPVPQQNNEVIYSKKIPGPVEDNTQLKVDFDMTVNPDGDYRTRLSSRVILATSPTSTTSIGDCSGCADRALNGGKVTVGNGFNCVNSGPCTRRHVGVMRITRDIGYGDLYVNVYGSTGEPDFNAPNGARVHFSGGDMTVRRYAPSLKG
jgi:hypothetical protein